MISQTFAGITETILKLLNPKNLFLIGLAIFSSISQTNANSQLKVTSEIIKQEYCLDNSPIFVEDSKTKNLKKIASVSTNLNIWVKLQLENIGSTPIIIQKDYFAISQHYIAKSLDLYYKGKFVSNVRALPELQFSSIEFTSPPQDKFITLNSGKSFTKEIELFIDLSENKSMIKDGNYYLSFILSIWGGQHWLGKKVREQWKDFGYLLFEPVIIKPISLSIIRPTNIEVCSD
jgi:hypothetical protein